MDQLRTIAHDPEKGGSRFGWHFVSTYRTCPFKWYVTYIRPRGEGAQGSRVPVTSTPLAVGSLVHYGLECWYLSGATDGRYDLEAAIRGMAEYARKAGWKGEWAAERLAEAQEIMERHHFYCGPDGVLPEYTSWRPVIDDDGPLVERTFEIELGYLDYVFTSQIDLVVTDGTRLYPLDHKTSAANRVESTRRQYEIDGQITGELWCMREAWGAEAVSDTALLNVIVKGAAARKAPRQLFTLTRTELDFEVFRGNIVRTLVEMNERVEEWQGYVATGMHPDRAAMLVFNSYPSGRTCSGEWWPCDYYDACTQRERLTHMLDETTEPRWTAAAPPTASTTDEETTR